MRWGVGVVVGVSRPVTAKMITSVWPRWFLPLSCEPRLIATRTLCCLGGGILVVFLLLLLLIHDVIIILHMCILAAVVSVVVVAIAGGGGIKDATGARELW